MPIYIFLAYFLIRPCVLFLFQFQLFPFYFVPYFSMVVLKRKIAFSIRLKQKHESNSTDMWLKISTKSVAETAGG